jgi:hypothetical protein
MRINEDPAFANGPHRTIMSCSSSAVPFPDGLDRLDGHLDPFGNYRRIVRHVLLVGQDQLKRMLSRGKRNFLLGLAVAEMNVT